MCVCEKVIRFEDGVGDWGVVWSSSRLCRCLGLVIAVHLDLLLHLFFGLVWVAGIVDLPCGGC